MLARDLVEHVSKGLRVMVANMQGLTGLTSNPVLANAISGLATSATAQATIEVLFLGSCLLYDMHSPALQHCSPFCMQLCSKS